MFISGVLKKEVTIDKITYKKGDTVTVPVQYGLQEYFEEPVKAFDKIKSEGTK